MRIFFKNLTIDLLLISISSILAGCAYFMLYSIVNLIMGSVVWNTILYFVLVFINILVPLLMVKRVLKKSALAFLLIYSKLKYLSPLKKSVPVLPTSNFLEKDLLTAISTVSSFPKSKVA